MKKIKYVVVKTSDRTWQIAEYETMANVPALCVLFVLRKQKFHSSYEAIKAAGEWQIEYDKSETKVLHDLAINPSESTPRQFRTLCEVL